MNAKQPVTYEQVKTALLKRSWRGRGTGPAVCYPDEVLLDLFGKEATKDEYLEGEAPK